MTKTVLQVIQNFITNPGNAETHQETLFLFYVLLILLGGATVLFLRRFTYLFRMKIDRSYFLVGVKNSLKKPDSSSKILEALTSCENSKTPIGSVAKSILSRKHLSEESMRRAAEEAATIEIPRLQRYIRVIAAIAYVSPFLGLLGTILSLMNLFGHIEQNTSAMSIQSMAPAVECALITTAFGIIVAVIVYLYTVILQERCHAIVLDMEKTATELINVIVEGEEHFAETVNAGLFNSYETTPSQGKQPSQEKK